MKGDEVLESVESHACLKGSQAVGGQLKGDGSVAPCSCSQGEEPLPCPNVQQHLLCIQHAISTVQLGIAAK